MIVERGSKLQCDRELDTLTFNSRQTISRILLVLCSAGSISWLLFCVCRKLLSVHESLQFQAKLCSYRHNQYQGYGCWSDNINVRSRGMIFDHDGSLLICASKKGESMRAQVVNRDDVRKTRMPR